MLTRLPLAVLILLALLVSALPAGLALANPPASAEPAPGRDFVAGELLVKLKPQPLEIGLAGESRTTPLAALNQRYGVTAVEPVFDSVPQAQGSVSSAVDEAGGDLSYIYKLRLPPEADVPAIAREYEANPAVEYAEPNYVVRVALAPNDYYYDRSGTWGQDYQDMWGLHQIQADGAWEVTQGNPEVIIAVLDTGVDYTHPDLADNMWVNADEVPGNGRDDDGNGYIDDVWGWDFVNRDNDPRDDHGHGTHVAGIAAARGNNDIGVVGVSWNSRVMALKFLDEDGQGTYADAALAVKYAAANGATIINCSWGGEGSPQTLYAALRDAASRGSLIIAAAGNDHKDMGAPGFFPANFDAVLAVAATDRFDYKAGFSNHGEHVAVSAPGVDILSLRAAATDLYGGGGRIVGERYYRASGTSMATPFVSGLAALIWSEHPDWDASLVRSAIVASADDIDPMNPQYAGHLGSGRINAARALSTATVTGQVHLQGRGHHGGVAISAAGYPTTTDDRGLFSLPLPPGNYEIRASHPGYLPASKADFRLEIGAAASTGPAVLLGGDVAPEYGIIDLQDLALIAASFNENENVADIDITGDGLVDIYDLTLVGGNYGRDASPWP